MRSKSIAGAIVLALLVTSNGAVHAAPAAQLAEVPVFRVQVWGLFSVDFSQRMSDYSVLRSELEKGLPSPMVTGDMAAVKRGVRALGSEVRTARIGAKEGDMFTPALAVEFKRVLLLEMDAATWASLMDDNPGGFSSRINGNYSDKRTLSSVPPGILAALPPLPDGVQYRFLGRNLILLDIRAGIILDRIPDAIRRCAGCNRRHSAGR
jgi:hypothetical protein